MDHCSMHLHFHDGCAACNDHRYRRVREERDDSDASVLLSIEQLTQADSIITDSSPVSDSSTPDTATDFDSFSGGDSGGGGTGGDW